SEERLLRFARNDRAPAMKELIDRILAYLPRFFLDLGALLAAPKRFIASKDIESNDAFADACLFLALAFSIDVIVTTPFRRPAVDFWMGTARYFESNILVVVCFGLAVRIAWWLVRGKASTRAIFVTYIYLIGAVTLMVVFWKCMVRGFVKI